MACGKLKFVNSLSGYELICDCNIRKVDWIEEVNFWVDVKERLSECSKGGMKRGRFEEEDWFVREAPVVPVVPVVPIVPVKASVRVKNPYLPKEKEEEVVEEMEMETTASKPQPAEKSQTDSVSSTGSDCSCPISTPPLCIIRAQHPTFCHCKHFPLISPLNGQDMDPNYGLRDMVMISILKGKTRKELEEDDTLKIVSGGNEKQWKWKLGEFLKGEWIYYDGNFVSIKKP